MGKKPGYDPGTGGFDNRLFKLKLLGGIWAGKKLMVLSRILGRGGTTLPGRIALKIVPQLSSALTERLAEKSLIVTGTNGKTTTSALISSILKNAGYRCIHNQSGSNMSWGVASALIGAASLTGKIDADFAVMEVDEGAFPGLTKEIRPGGIVLTNIFRDQLDRYGEVDHVRDSIKLGLELQPDNGFEVINADDPSLASIKNITGKKRWTYGLALDLPEDTFQNTGRDIKSCPACNEKLVYTKIYFAHLGHYHCQVCSYKRPEPEVRLVGQISNPKDETILKISLPESELEVKNPLPGTYNLYNVLAAITCAKALEIPDTAVVSALESAAPSFGRMELFEIEGKTMIMALIKNPVGANEVLRTILAQTDSISLLVAINDKIADGTDVSWLWDVDFDQLCTIKEKFSTVTVSGLRALDMAVRFKYAGFNPEQINVEENTTKAIKSSLQQTPPGGRLFILPTYTAMLEMRRILSKSGLAKPYWEN
ncbi:MAG: MurT ligase domain-containing protein [Bacillota bacterium]